MKDMTSREILDAFARGLEEAARPFEAQRKPKSKQVLIPLSAGVSEDARTFDRTN